MDFYAQIGNVAETCPFSETSRCQDRHETEALDLRDRDETDILKNSVSRHYSSARNPDQCVLQANGATLKQVKKIKYLGVAFSSDGRQDEELDTRIGKASAVMRAFHYLVVMKKAKLSIFKAVFVPILTYSMVMNLG